MAWRNCVLLLLVAASAVLVAGKSYYGYQLMRVSLNSASQVQLLQSLQNEYFELDFWKEPALHHIVDVNVPPHLLRTFSEACAKENLKPQMLQDNVQNLIDSNKASKPKLRRLNEMAAAVHSDKPIPLSTVYDDIVGTFPRHNSVNNWLSDLARVHSAAEVYNIGSSYEGRQMNVIKISANGDFSGRKPVIWVDSAIHAREWLTVGTTIWIINKMLTSYGTDEDVREMMDRYEWHFLPVSNPDGYEYTHTSDRLWRKTRSHNWGSSCVGTDPNRNWEYMWGVSGTSTSPCSDTYGGPSAGSETCVQNMKQALLQVTPRMTMYMGIHAYSQLLLTPWAWGGSKPADYSDLLDVANVGATAIRRTHGERFTVGTPPDILYSASGGAYDWVKATAGVKYSYTYELRPDNYAWNGFVVSESEITPSGEEIWASLVAMIRKIETIEN